MNENDLKTLAQKGITAEQVQQQLNRFKTGFPTLEIIDSATVGNGIMRLSAEQQQAAANRWQLFLNDGGEVCKFVPASGAASRMFKALFNFADGDTDSAPAGSDVAQVLDRIEEFAFYPELNDACQRICGKSVNELRAAGENRKIISAIISPEGLNYGQLPKGLLQFHKYAAGPRTPLEEQIAEGAATAAAAGGTLNLHFTVSPNHRKLFEEKLARVIPDAEKHYGIKINAELSEQKAQTDTIAANPDGTPFRTNEGSLLFRPGGHGALIANLNDIHAAVVFIKNIDNVVPDAHRDPTVQWKRILAGQLILVHDQIAAHLQALKAADAPAHALTDAADFLKSVLNVSDTKMQTLAGEELRQYLIGKLNRPLRVCGMVINEGEPGGGPYITVNSDGSASPQILESHQISPKYTQILAKSTHFNPVDLVCYIADTDGHHFNLPDYVDPATGFISAKSQQGRELLALELPGLWNGAIREWNTLFIVVPPTTFNPVKTVNDLLRPAHQ